MEAQDSSDQEDEEIDNRPSMTREHEELMRKLNFLFPDNFCNNLNESMPAAQRV